jgi:hypothetical protein
LQRDLPDEVPLQLETSIDHLTARDSGGFRGQACYDLVRTFRSTTPGNAYLAIGRTGLYRGWLDGVELGSSDAMRAWSVMDDSTCRSD